jgi:hypothetical protein
MFVSIWYPRFLTIQTGISGSIGARNSIRGKGYLMDGLKPPEAIIAGRRINTVR